MYCLFYTLLENKFEIRVYINYLCYSLFVKIYVPVKYITGSFVKVLKKKNGDNVWKILNTLHVFCS